MVYVGLGFGCVGLALLGLAVPGLPTTPFVLLASFFFVRSSPRLHRWLLRSRVFGPFLRDWHERRGVRRSVKFTAVGMILVVIPGSVYLGQLSWPLIALVCVLGLIGIVVVLRLPVVDAAARAQQDSLPQELEQEV